MKKILLAEDEEDLRNFLYDELTDAGFSITPVKDGSEVVVAVVDEVFDLFLLDMLMPKLDGIQTIRILHRIVPNVPIIGITGYLNQGYMLQAVTFYGVTCLSKPIAMATLIAEINKALRRKL